MFSKNDIRKVSIIVNKKHYNKLIYELGNSELIHLSKVNIENKEPKHTYKENDETRISTLLPLIKSLSSEVDIETQKIKNENNEFTEELFKSDNELNINELEISKIRKKIDQIKKLQSAINNETTSSLEKLKELKEIKELDIIPERPFQSKFCSIVFGTSSKEITDNYNGKQIIIKQFGQYVIGITTNSKKEEMTSILNKYGFEDKSFLINSKAGLEESINNTKKKIEISNSRNEIISDYQKKITSKWINQIIKINNSCSDLQHLINAGKMFHVSDEVLIINGWINMKQRKELISILEKLCEKNFFLSITSKSEMKKYIKDAPVILKNNRIFKSFELIVKNMGLPGNSEVDPTPLAAITYMLMFGVMFGDVGQGIVLSLTGFILKSVAKRKNLKEGALYDGGSILIFCGFSASIFGFLYGSIFSNEHLLPAIWFHPMDEMMKLFFAAIMMGASFIVIGIILNIINGIQTGHLNESIFGTKGINGLIIYSGIIFIFIRKIQFDIAPSGTELLFLIAVPVLIFILRNPLSVILFKEKNPFPHGIFEYAVETIVEIIEMFSSFLGNTISFIRAGAFALSHAGLSIAIYTLAEIISPEGYSFASVTAIVIGNIFIILLEGLVCGIQSMRLEYYEFFGKFFKGDGIEFKPFSLRKQIYY